MVDELTGEVLGGAAVRFVGSIAPVAGALKLHGDGGGLRLMIDVPASHMAEALRLVAYTGMALTVTIEPGEVE